jgi:hypothetical protein
MGRIAFSFDKLFAYVLFLPVKPDLAEAGFLGARRILATHDGDVKRILQPRFSWVQDKIVVNPRIIRGRPSGRPVLEAPVRCLGAQQKPFLRGNAGPRAALTRGHANCLAPSHIQIANTEGKLNFSQFCPAPFFLVRISVIEHLRRCRSMSQTGGETPPKPAAEDRYATCSSHAGRVQKQGCTRHHLTREKAGRTK